MMHIKRREEFDFGYEIFIAAVSILSVFNMIISLIPGFDQDSVNVVYIINSVLTLLFIYDFIIRVVRAPSRPAYFFKNYGWADLLAIIPALRTFRLFRIYKAYRVVKKIWNQIHCFISLLQPFPVSIIYSDGHGYPDY